MFPNKGLAFIIPKSTPSVALRPPSPRVTRRKHLGSPHRLADANISCGTYLQERNTFCRLRSVPWTYKYTPLYLDRIPLGLMRVRKALISRRKKGIAPVGNEVFLVIQVVNIRSVSSSKRPHPPNAQNGSREKR